MHGFGMVRRTSKAVLTLALALGAGAAHVPLATAQPVDGSQGSRFQDFQLRTEPAGNGRILEDEASEPALPSDPGQFENAPALPAAPAEPIDRPDDAERESQPSGLEFDLFDDPQAPRGGRRTAPEALPAGPAAAQGISADRAASQPASLPFRTTGPVRSPTFSPAGAEERINRAAADLRPSFPTVETDPFAADGIRVGRFRLYPVLRQELGASDNLDDSPTEESGVFSDTVLSARLVSDWARHQAEIDASASYRRNSGGSIEEDPRFAVDARLLLDLGADWSGAVRGALAYSREDPIRTDPLLPPSDRPDVLAYSVGADLTREVGRTGLTASGDVVREERRFDGASGADDFTTATLGLRAGYAFSPALEPFVQGSLGRRMFDGREDGTGLDRDSAISALRAGIAFDLGEKISGEAALGYAWNAPVAGALPTLGSPTADVSVAWSPKRGTDVLLTAATFFDPDSGGLSTSTVYETALALQHRATARLDLTGRVTAALRDRSGPSAVDDQTYAGEAGLTYWINRGLAFTALARHERLESEIEAARYSANSIRLGIRLQR